MKSTFKPLGTRQNFLAIDREHSSFDSSKIVVLPVPYEHSAGSPTGAKRGPQAILSASHDLEVFDEETKREIPKEFGIATLSPIDFAGKKTEAALQLIHESVLSLIGLNKFVVTLGGEHTITSAAIAAFAKKLDNLSVLQFDAHSNLRNDYRGDKYSDGCVMARVCEFLDPSRLVQVGIRSQSREEAEFIRDANVSIFYAHDIRGGTYTKLLKYWDDVVVDRLTENVYVTFDLDAFDPSIMPSTNLPEPNGLFWIEVMRCLKKVGKKRTIVGFDVVELAPIQNLRFPEIAAAKLVLKMLNYAL